MTKQILKIPTLGESQNYEYKDNKGLLEFIVSLLI
jgi:hypothetical protein